MKVYILEFEEVFILEAEFVLLLQKYLFPKPNKTTVTLLFGGNVKRDFKLRPFLVHNAVNMGTIKYITDQPEKRRFRLMKNLVLEYAINLSDIRFYCDKEKSCFKALKIIDSAASHPNYLYNLSENLKTNLCHQTSFNIYKLLRATIGVGHTT